MKPVKSISKEAANLNDKTASPSASSQDSDSEPGSPIFKDPPKKLVDPEQAFEDFYLTQATKEFANDLDKLRSAGDFKDSSVPILIDALKQGKACFSKTEREKIGRAAVVKKP